MRQSGFSRRRAVIAAALLTSAIAAPAAWASDQKAYDPGASDSEIRIGHSTAYSGPVSMLGSTGRTLKAFFDRVNASGGINGRKVTIISLDDGYSPPKALEQARRLVESEGVLMVFGVTGTPPNVAIHKYLNGKKVPQVGVASGSPRFNDPEHYPWTMPFYPSSRIEQETYARYIAKADKNAKIGVLYANDDYGKESLEALRHALGAHGKAVHRAVSYETTDALVDTQILNLKDSGATVLVTIASPKFAALAMRKVQETGWKPLQIMTSAGNAAVPLLRAAGSNAANGVITASYVKAPDDPALATDPDVIAYRDFMQKWNPQDNANDLYPVTAYLNAALLKYILERAGDNLTRANIMKIVGDIQSTRFPMHQPSIVVKTSPDNFDAYKTLALQKFNGNSWESTQ